MREGAVVAGLALFVLAVVFGRRAAAPAAARWAGDRRGRGERGHPVALLARLRAAAAGGRSDDAELAVLLEAVAASLRSGATVPGAILEAAHASGGSRLLPVTDLLRSAVPLDAALGAWARSDSGGTALAAASLGMAADLGGRAAAAVDGVAATLRARAGVASEARALATQARVSVGVLVATPLVFGALSTSVDPRVGGFFLTAPGIGCALLAAALDGAGAWWMARLVRRVV